MNVPPEDHGLVRREHAKRDRVLGPSGRWRMIQQAIEQADRFQPVPRNSPAGCLAHARRRDEPGGMGRR